MTAVQTPIILSIDYKEQSVKFDVSAAQTAEEVNAIVAASFHLHKGARFVLKRAEDGAIVVAGPGLAAGEYILQLVDDGRGGMKKNAILALVGAPLLLLYYRLILPKLIGDE